MQLSNIAYMEEVAQVYLLKSANNKKNHAPWIASIWIASGFSSEMVIPKKLAQKYRMDEPCSVVLEEKEDGIFIRRLDL
jgi:hypothetical protein